mmetsp:Transcript_11343/g.17206  ORF Transcript_11343/g.17206 Transcript_11343/m.17206 type:complete len:281 (-) Transcript_11343:1812-2654(-)
MWFISTFFSLFFFFEESRRVQFSSHILHICFSAFAILSSSAFIFAFALCKSSKDDIVSADVRRTFSRSPLQALDKEAKFVPGKSISSSSLSSLLIENCDPFDLTLRDSSQLLVSLSSLTATGRFTQRFNITSPRSKLFDRSRQALASSIAPSLSFSANLRSSTFFLRVIFSSCKAFTCFSNRRAIALEYDNLSTVREFIHSLPTSSFLASSNILRYCGCRCDDTWLPSSLPSTLLVLLAPPPLMGKSTSNLNLPSGRDPKLFTFNPLSLSFLLLVLVFPV